MKSKIVLFEDNEPKRDSLKCLVEGGLKSVEVVFLSTSGTLEEGVTYEHVIEKEFLKISDTPLLVICDKDLSGMRPRFIGLSCEAVSSVSEKLGWPICLYARGEHAQTGEKEYLESLAPWAKKTIVLPDGQPEKIAQYCIGMYKGFNEIAKFFEKNISDGSSPSLLMASLLGKPEVAGKIGLYASGEQSILSEVMPYLQTTGSSDILRQRAPRIFGNWLYSSLLRFPGLLVNETAAYSYLNISKSGFSKSEVRNLFSSAQYKGPFSSLESWWWRHDLDNLLGDAGCDDGIAFAKKKGITVRGCSDGGFYCMVTGTPVSAAQSKGGLGWFPAGADLARIKLEKYHELEPWVGLY